MGGSLGFKSKIGVIMNVLSDSMSVRQYGYPKQGAWCKFKELLGLHKCAKKAAAAMAKEANNAHASMKPSGKGHPHTRISVKDAHILSEVVGGNSPEAMHQFGPDAAITPTAGQSLQFPKDASAMVHDLVRSHSTGPLSDDEILSKIKAITTSGKAGEPQSPSFALGNSVASLDAAKNKALSIYDRGTFLDRARAWGERAVVLGGLTAPGQFSSSLDMGILSTIQKGWFRHPKTNDAKFWNLVQEKLDKQVAEVPIDDLKNHYSKLKDVSAEDRMVALIRISHEAHKLEKTTTHWGYWHHQMKDVKASEDQIGNLAGNIWDIYDLTMRRIK